MGDVMGDLSSRRGKISGMETDGGFQKIKAQVPLADLYKYSTALRSLTQGRGHHTRNFSHYEEVPRETIEKIVKYSLNQKKIAFPGFGLIFFMRSESEMESKST